MKRIVFVNSTLGIGGAERMLYEIARHLDRETFRIKICCLYAPGAIGDRLLKEGVELRHSFMKNKFDLMGIYRLLESLKREDIDLLYLEGSPLTLFWGFICGRLAGAADIVTISHSMRKPFKWDRFKSDMVNRVILPRLTRIGAVSRAKQNAMIDQYNLEPYKVKVINNGIDADNFTGDKDTKALRRELGISRDEKIIGMVGRLTAEKAYDVFLKSAQRILRDASGVKFLIVGDGKERGALERLADESGIRDKVIFLGERSDVKDLIVLFDVAVLSSRVESFPVALLEYMAASRPIVATRAGGNTEVISEGESGLIVSPDNPEELADAILELVKDKEKAMKMGRSARKRVKREFSLDKMTDKIEKFFLDAISSYAASHVIMAGPRLDVKGGISSFAKNYLSPEPPEGLKITYHPTTIDGNRITKSFYFIKSIASFVVRLIFDRTIKVVHICSASKGSFYRKLMVLLISKIFRKKAIFHIHGAGFDVFYDKGPYLNRFFIRWALDISDTILVLSETWLSKISAMTTNGNIKVIPNTVDTSDIRSIRARDSKWNIFTAGRLEKRKGTYDILEIAPFILKEMPDVKFYLAGDGDIEKVRRLSREKGIEKSVILLGWLDRRGLLDAFMNAAIFLLPSYHEGMPVAILEAMAAGLPVISTRVGGIPEIVEDGVNGFLVNPGEKERLREQILKLLKDRGLRERMGEDNVKKIDSEFRSDKVADRFYAEYRQLVERTRADGRRHVIKWYARRLFRMSFQEIIYRAYRSAEAYFGRFTKKGVDLNKALDKKAGKANFYFDALGPEKTRKGFLDLFTRRVKHIIAEAEALRRHSFRIFGISLEAPGDIDWHKDIITGKSWPLKYWADLDFRNNGDSGEVRFTWELNRHQHLVTLGKAYLVTQDKRYAEEVKREILSWIKNNPPHVGINWTSPLELGLRIISWCWAYKFIESSGVFSADEKETFLESVYMQTEFISHNLSRYSSANNHLIGESCALVNAGLTFPEFRRSKKWLNKGRKVLFKEILKQVHPDGITKEQAFHYQGFVMELYLLAFTLFIKNNMEIPESVLDRFRSMCEFIMNVMDGNGRVPHVGDSDNGRAIVLSEDKGFSAFKSLLSSAAILFDRGDFKAKGSGFQEEHYLLFGIEGYKAYKKIKEKTPHLSSRLFAKGGYALLGSPSRNGSRRFLMMDCGELGYASIAAHGHADLMSVVLSSDGTELLIDPGTYLYHRGGAWRDYFRGTSAHNTITVNDRNQAEMTGPFMWGARRPKIRIEKWESSEKRDYISASYTNCTVRHRRDISFHKEKEVFLMEDFLEAKGKNVVRQYFHLPPAAIIKELDIDLIEVKNRSAFLYMLFDRDFKRDIKRGEESPILGWSSHVFGAKSESATLVNTAYMRGAEKFNTLLYVSDKRWTVKQLRDVFGEYARAKGSL